MLLALFAHSFAAASALNVMSFNIRYGTADDGDDRWEFRRDMCIDIIRDSSPDILLIQEALRFQLEEIRAAVPGYSEIGCGREDGKEKGEYAAILFKRSTFEIVDSGWFWLSDFPDEPNSMTWGNRVTRICTWAVLEFGDQKFAVYNTHLDHESRESREKSISMIVRHMTDEARGLPVVFGGDFNAGESNAAIVRLSEGSARKQIDSFRVVNPDGTDVGTYHEFKGTTAGDKIDYIFVSPEWKVLGAQILRSGKGGRYPSDHFPVTAQIALSGFAPQ